MGASESLSKSKEASRGYKGKKVNVKGLFTKIKAKVRGRVLEAVHKVYQVADKIVFAYIGQIEAF